MRVRQAQRITSLLVLGPAVCSRLAHLWESSLPGHAHSDQVWSKAAGPARHVLLAPLYTQSVKLAGNPALKAHR